MFKWLNRSKLMWEKFRKWLCDIIGNTPIIVEKEAIVTNEVMVPIEVIKEVPKEIVVERLVTDADPLEVVIAYIQGDVDMKVIKKLNELTGVAAMRDSGRLDQIQVDAINKALNAWCRKESTPQEFVNLFRGGR